MESVDRVFPDAVLVERYGSTVDRIWTYLVSLGREEYSIIAYKGPIFIDVRFPNRSEVEDAFYRVGDIDTVDALMKSVAISTAWDVARENGYTDVWDVTHLDALSRPDFGPRLKLVS